MNTTVSITYNTAAPARSVDAYTVSLHDDDAEATGRLVRQGATFNNLTFYKGTFASKDDAVTAALAYIGAPCKLVEFASPRSTTHRVMNPRARAAGYDDTTARVLGTNA